MSFPHGAMGWSVIVTFPGHTHLLFALQYDRAEESQMPFNCTFNNMMTCFKVIKDTLLKMYVIIILYCCYNNRIRTKYETCAKCTGFIFYTLPVVCLFALMIYVPINTYYGHVEKVSSPNHTFFHGKLD